MIMANEILINTLLSNGFLSPVSLRRFSNAPFIPKSENIDNNLEVASNKKYRPITEADRIFVKYVKLPNRTNALNISII